MAERIGVGVVGVGFGGAVHVPAFASLPGVEVIGVADGGSGTAREVAGRLGHGVRAFDSWKRLVEAPEMDAVSVATPPAAQAEVICAALAAGKHVLCEKPFGRGREDADRMRDAVGSGHQVSAVNFEFRMEPGIAELKRRAAAGEIGRILRVDATWLTGGGAAQTATWSWRNDRTAGGGVMGAFGSHIVDYVQWISESSVVAVFARTEVLLGRRPGPDGREQGVTAEDSADVVCELSSGAVASLRFSNCYPCGSGHRIEVYGERGSLSWVHEAPFEPGTARLRVETPAETTRSVPVALLQESGLGDTRTAAVRELARRFVDAIRRHAAPDLPDFGCGWRVRRVLDAALESAARRARVTLPEDG